eukprot:12886751-Prorocentrum_lima.AAC.1
MEIEDIPAVANRRVTTSDTSTLVYSKHKVNTSSYLDNACIPSNMSLLNVALVAPHPLIVSVP